MNEPLHFNPAGSYSKEIDIVQVTAGSCRRRHERTARAVEEPLARKPGALNKTRIEDEGAD